MRQRRMRAAEMGPGHQKDSAHHRQMWLEYTANSDFGLPTRLPNIFLKCTSMIMDTMNFSINYAGPFTSVLLQKALRARPPAPQTGQQESPSDCDCHNTALHQSHVKMTLQYLGSAFSITSEIINPKDELSMFQQICRGENICVFKGYLSPGDMFQILSRRHYGFPFSASIYINGLITARISWCCEYRLHGGIQQGRRDCFRITELNGGRPCYRCVQFHTKYQTRPEKKQSSSGRTCEGSVSSKHKDNQREKTTDKLETNTRAPHNLYPAPPQPSVRRRRRKKMHLTAEGSNSQPENKEQDRRSRGGSRRSRRTLSFKDKSAQEQTKVAGGDPPQKTKTLEYRAAGAVHRPTKDKEPTDHKAPGVASTAQAQRLESSRRNVEEEPKDAGQTLHRRLGTTIREWSAHSEVELSDSSESSDYPGSITALEQQVAAEGPEQISEVIAEDEGLICQIEDLIAVLQKCEEVDQLILRNTGMTDALLHRLTPAISASKSEVDSINLNLNEIGPPGAKTIVCLLRDKPCVRSLLLYGNHLGTAGIETLMVGLSDLWLQAWEMSSASSPRVSSFHLSELDIGGNRMDCEGLRSVAAFLKLNPPLRKLFLAQSPVADMGTWAQLCDAVKVNTNLTHLLLDDNSLGDLGAKLVAEVIQMNQSLLSLDLDGNDIGEEGGRAIAESLNSSGALTAISLENNPISTETLHAINWLLMTRTSKSGRLRQTEVMDKEGR